MIVHCVKRGGVTFALVVSFALGADAATKYWVGTDATSPTLASVAANWADDASGTAATAAPAEGDDIVLDALAGNRALTWDLDVSVGSWTQSADYTGTVTFYTGRAENATTHGVTSSDAKTKELRITGNISLSAGTWTTPAQPSLTASDAAWQEGNGIYRLVARIGGTLTVAAAASIDVTAKGFAANEGPGIGSHGGVGAGCCGDAYDYNGHEFSHNDAYGSIKQPVTIGSGADAGAGGGGIELEVTGAATVNGVIRADGAGSGHEDDSCTYSCGGGGGGIWIKAASLTGAGTISACHGYVCYGGGGGGRVSVVLTGEGATFANWTGTVAASDNFNDWDSWYYNYPSPGTIYLEEAGLGGVGDLVLKDGCTYDMDCMFWSYYSSVTPMPTNNVEDVHFRDVLLTNGVMLAAYTGAVLRVDRSFVTDSRAMDEWEELHIYEMNFIFLKGGGIDLRAQDCIPNVSLYGEAPGSVLSAPDGSMFHVKGNNVFGFSYDMTLNGGLCIEQKNSDNYNYPFFYGTTAIHGDVLNMTGAYPYFSGPTTIDGNLTIQSNSYIRMVAAGGNTTDPRYADYGYRLNLTVGGDATIASNAYLYADNCGYYHRWSVFGYLSDENKLDGGSYGGCAAYTSGEMGTYGNPAEPTDIGAGGGDGSYGRGGGAIRLAVAGTLTLNGQVRANANNVTATTGAGAGSGGSIWITCSNLVGDASSIIMANGGYSTYRSSTESTSENRRHGGGGRVAVHLTGADSDFSQYLGTIQAHGGFYTNDCVTSRQGGAGTVYLKKGNGESTLILDNGTTDLYPMRTATPAPTDFSANITNVVYGEVRVANGAWLCPAVGAPLQVAGDFYGDGSVTEPMGEGRSVWSTEVGGVEFVDATRTSTISGKPVFRLLKCAAPGKTVRIATGSDNESKIGVGGYLRLAGTAENKVVLCSTSEGVSARFLLANGGQSDVSHATVRDIDSSGYGTFLAHTTSSLSSVQNWKQMDPTPGVNTWQGGTSENWGYSEYWSQGRAPMDGDTIVISSGRATLPCLYVFARLTVGEDATFDLNGTELGMSGNVTISGTLLNADTATLYLLGGDLTVALDGNAFGSVETLTGNVTFTDPFSAATFAASAPGVTNLTFAAGKTFAFGVLQVDGRIDDTAVLAMKSSQPGSSWRLSVTGNADVRGVKLSDSSVVSGSVLVGDRAPSVDGGGNSGWVFGAKVATTCVPASSYIQAGLVANFDAIENAGHGFHDVMPTEWVNLASGCDNLPMPAGCYTFNSQSLVVNRDVLVAPNLESVFVTTPVSLQAYARVNNVDGASGILTYASAGTRVGLAYSTSGYANYVEMAASVNANSTSVSIYHMYVGRYRLADVAYSNRTFTATCGYGWSGAYKGYLDDEYLNISAAARNGSYVSSSMPGSKLYIGNASAEYEYGSVRYYSRELSAAESLVNSNIDKMRFAGAKPESLTWPDNHCWEDNRVKWRFTVDCDPRYGSVTVNGGEPKSGRFDVTYEIGSEPTITLVATPSEGATGFFKWQGSGIEPSTESTLTFTATTNVTEVVALFKADDIHYIPTDFASPSAALASDSVKSNDTLYILDGTYTSFPQVTYAAKSYSCIAAVTDKPVTIRGRSRGSVLIDCGQKGGFVLAHTNAVLANMTIYNFMRNSGVQSPALYMPAGVATNIEFSGASGTVYQFAGDLWTIYVGPKALLTDTVIRNVNRQGNNMWANNYLVRVAGGTLRRAWFRHHITFGSLVDVVYDGGRRPRIEQCKFTDNFAYGYAIAGSNCDVLDSTFTHSNEKYYIYDDNGGGLIYLSGTSTLTRNYIEGCRLCYHGLIECAGTLSITNCLVTKNVSPTHGAICVCGNNARVNIVHSTIADNQTTSASYAGGISCNGLNSGNAVVRMINSVLWNNKANGEVKNFCDSYSYTTLALSNSCFTGWTTPAEAGNTTDDPKFVRALGGDYRLGDGSSCINLGQDAPTLTHDLDGKKRPIDGIGAGELKWDAGCYEADGPTVALKATLLTYGEQGEAPCTVTQGVAVVGSNLSGLTYEWWALRQANGELSTNIQYTTEARNVFTNLEIGVYTFQVIVRNDQGGAATNAVEEAFKAKTEAAYASPNGSDAWPYSTPETAAHSIVDAAGAALKRVIILEGKYSEASPQVETSSGQKFFFVDTTGMIFEGPDDPSEVVIDCGGEGGFRLDHDDSRVSGVTLKNFLTSSTSGSAIYVAKGAVSNIVCRGDGANGAAAQPCVYGGHQTLLEDMVITNFWAAKDGRRPLLLSGATMRRATIRWNRSTTKSVISMTRSSGGTAARLEDTLIADNTAQANSLFDLSQSVALRCTITRNESINKTDSLIWSYGASWIENCAISNNSTKCTLNVAQFWGNEYLTLRNSLLVWNDNGAFATVSQTSTPGYFNVQNCTIAWNVSASGAGAGGLYAAPPGYASVVNMYNTIVWGNTVAGVQKDVLGNATTRNYQYSAFKEASSYPNKHNLMIAPGLKRKNSHVTGLAPTKDAGLTNGIAWIVAKDAVDLDGKPRIANKTVDMGCYEDPKGRGVMVIIR